MFDPFLLSEKVLAGVSLTRDDVFPVLVNDSLDLPDLVAAAYRIRKHYFGREVILHVLNNVQNGLCPEDCRYCAQSTSSTAPIEEYPMKPDDEILREAQAAYDNGAGRYCMVFSGAGPSSDRIEHLCRLITTIKSRLKIEVCVSPGAVSRQQAARLKAAGLDRLNHNLNTPAGNYSSICSTHSFADRLATLTAARAEGLAVCSGIIVGMGETVEELIGVAETFRDLAVESIPVNFLIPISGVSIANPVPLTPEYCLRVLCLFRFLNPRAEIRMAAGRELHLRSLEPLGLFVANSLFLNGYLNAGGHSDVKTLNMIRDAAFSIKSDIPLDQLAGSLDAVTGPVLLKNSKELRPCRPDQNMGSGA